MVILENWQFDILTDYREGFNEEALLARYSDVLLKYDVDIVKFRQLVMYV